MRIDRIKLISEMARRDMTATRLAQETSLSRVSIGNIRRGASCRYETAEINARALGVPVEDLLEDAQ